MQDLLNNLQNIDPGVLAALAGVVGVSIAVQLIKHYLALTNPKIITAVLGAFSFAAGVVQYISQAAAQNPSILGQKTLAIAGGATFAYRFVIKPLTNLLSDAKAQRSLQATKTPASATTIVNPSALETNATQTIGASVASEPAFVETPVQPLVPAQFDA